MEVFIDLKDPTCRWWFREDLPAIIDAYVRTGALKLRNTYWPAVFTRQQTRPQWLAAYGRRLPCGVAAHHDPDQSLLREGTVGA